MLSTVFAFLLLLTNDDAITGDAATDSATSNAPPAIIAGKETADAAAPSAMQKWTLRYQFRPEEKFRYETHQTMTLDARVGENRKVDVSELKQRRVFTVISADESGDAQLAMQFEHVWMKIQTDDHEAVVFDSTMEAGEVPVVFRNTAHQLKGSAPKYFLSDLGVSLIESRKAARFAAKSVVQAAFAFETGVPLAVWTTTSVETAEGKHVPATDPGSFLMPLPEDPVSIGDTWKETVTVSVRLTRDINSQILILRTFRLESVNDGIATVSFRSSIESPVKGPNVRSQLIQAIPRGTMRFDIARGVMLRRELQFNETIIGAFGRESLLSSVGANTEQLLESDPVPATVSAQR